MSKSFKILLVIFLVGISALLIPRMIPDRVAMDNQGEPLCPGQDLTLFFDHPMERIILLLGDFAILESDDHKYIIRIYAPFGIPYATVELNGCYGAIKRI